MCPEDDKDDDYLLGVRLYLFLFFNYKLFLLTNSNNKKKAHVILFNNFFLQESNQKTGKWKLKRIDNDRAFFPAVKEGIYYSGSRVWVAG